MKIVLGVLVALALTACGGPSKPASGTPAESSSVTLSSATSSPAATPLAGEKPSREFVIGKWGTDGDCTMAIDLRPDGTSDGPFGNWAYRDGVISFPEEPDFKVDVTVLDQNTMNSTHAGSDKVTKMTRCP